MNEIKNKDKMIFCEPCSFKMILPEGKIPDNLIQIKTASIQSNIPNLDSKSGKIVNKKNKELSKKVKCPKCGRAVVVKELQNSYASTIKKIKEQEAKEKANEDRKKRIEDGKLLDKKPDLDF